MSLSCEELTWELKFKIIGSCLPLNIVSWRDKQHVYRAVNELIRSITARCSVRKKLSSSLVRFINESILSTNLGSFYKRVELEHSRVRLDSSRTSSNMSSWSWLVSVVRELAREHGSWTRPVNMVCELGSDSWTSRC